MLERSAIASLPKVVLHDHLDGDLRAQTIIDIASEIGYDDLPFNDAELLSQWFFESCNDGSLEKYLRTFDHTIAVMQRAEDIVRVSRECVLDLAFDNVVYGEIRVAPEHFTKQGLTLDDVVAAMLQGFREGESEAEKAGKSINVEAILCAMRHNDRSMEIAELVHRWFGRGVVGFDIAGAEKGFPASNHRAAFDYLHSHNIPYTIHAGEADGVSSIQDALENCRATRIGHGVRIIDDIRIKDDSVELSAFAALVHERGIHLELAPSSNLQTGAAESYASHPIGILTKLGFNTGINTDNRLMSRTNVSNEIYQIAAAQQWNLVQVRTITENAIRAAFIDDSRKSALLETIAKHYAHLS